MSKIFYQVGDKYIFVDDETGVVYEAVLTPRTLSADEMKNLMIQMAKKAKKDAEA